MEFETKVRASALSGWPDCPRRGAAKLFRGEIIAAGYTLRETPRGIGATVGTAVHSGVALTLTEKMRFGRLAPISAVTDCAVESYRENAAEGVLFDKETANGNAAEKQITGMVEAYQRVIAPQIEPIIVEERLQAETDFGIILTGQNDVLAREPGRLRDCKTGKRQGKHVGQIGAYSLLIKSNGLDVSSACTDFIQRVPASKVQPDPVTTEYDLIKAENVAINILRHIAGDLRTFREGDSNIGLVAGDATAFLANPNSMLCSEKFCPAHGTNWCNEWTVGHA